MYILYTSLAKQNLKNVTNQPKTKHSFIFKILIKKCIYVECRENTYCHLISSWFTNGTHKKTLFCDFPEIQKYLLHNFEKNINKMFSCINIRVAA